MKRTYRYEIVGNSSTGNSSKIFYKDFKTKPDRNFPSVKIYTQMIHRNAC